MSDGAQERGRWRPSRRRRGWRPSIESLVHFRGQAPWSDAALLARVRDWVLPRIEQRGRIRAWIVDDTGFPKKGKYSVALRASIAASWASRTTVRLRLAYRSPMTQLRFRSPTNCISRTVGRRIRNNPRRPRFRQRSRSGLSRRSRSRRSTGKAEGVAPGVVLADAGYGADGGFRARLSKLGLAYVVGSPHSASGAQAAHQSHARAD